jgi:hypothetical protein
MTNFASIATVPKRESMLAIAVESLESQATVEVYRNKAWGDLPGDYGKFHWLGKVDADYYFTCDDDIGYPFDYCTIMAMWSDYFDATVTLHGNAYMDGANHESFYYGAFAKYRIRKALEEAVYVDVPGSGVTCIPRRLQKPIAEALEPCEHPNMADLYLAKALRDLGEDVICVPHTDDWLMILDNNGRNVWEDINQNGGDERPMIEMLNRVMR